MFLDVPQQLDILARIFDGADQITFDNKSEYIQALKSISSTQTTMHTSDIESLGNLFEGKDEEILKHPHAFFFV